MNPAVLLQIVARLERLEKYVADQKALERQPKPVEPALLKRGPGRPPKVAQ